MTRPAAIGLALIAVLVGSVQAQTVLYVDENADQTPHDGSDWCHAYLELYEALAVAGPDTVIRVADGTYLPDTSGLGDPRLATFQLANGVTIEGGYAGCGATDPDARDITLYETILSGDIGTPDDSDNCYHVVTGSGTDATAVLDGVTITAGNADGISSPHYYGGGMYNELGDPTLIHCTFSGNSAGQAGGGMYNDESDPTLTDCTFSGNSASYGSGGMSNNEASSPTLTDCTFSGNSGGGMSNGFDTSPTLTNCTFIGNSTSYSGGGMSNGDCSPTLTNCTFIGNSATNWGGGMSCTDCEPELMLTDCTFTGNWATRGGGMASNHSGPTLTNCTFSGNWATEHGGGMYNDFGWPTLTNCTFSANSASGYGGGMCNFDWSNLTLANCILWGNTAPNGPEIFDSEVGTTTATYSCVQGGWPGTGNISAYPKFVAGYYLAQIAAGQPSDSPCVDAGDPASPMIVGTTRTDGVQDAGVVDMGYHHSGPACMGDLNGDGYRNVTDFTLFAGTYLSQAGDPNFSPYADLDGDGFVNITDFTIFGGYYLVPCP